MVQEIPKKQESDSQESRSLNNAFTAASSGDTSIWPVNKTEADNQRNLLNRFSTQDIGKAQLPLLPELQKEVPSQTTKPAGGDTLPNGARVIFNSDNTVSKLTRKDGSSVDITYENGKKKQVIDCNKDGTARTVWSANAIGIWEPNSQVKDKNGNWASDGKPGREYRDIRIDEQGVTTAIDLVGFRDITTPAGVKLATGSICTFDEKGRINSASYDPGSNSSLKFHYDANDKIAKVDTIDSEGKVQESRVKTGEDEWKILKRDGSTAGTWKGQMELSPDGNFRQQEAKDKAAGVWQVISPFQMYAEKVSPDGKHISRVFRDKSEHEFDKTADGQERLTKITRGKESREFRYDADGKLAQLVETNASGTINIKTDGMIAKIGMAGEVSLEKPDGSKTIKRADFSTEEQDKDGNLLKVSKDGKTRWFDYETIGNTKQLVKITNTVPGKSGDIPEVWTRSKNADGSYSKQFLSVGADGSQKAIAEVGVLYNGDYRFKSSDGKDRIARMGNDSNSREGVSGGVSEARERLMAILENQLDAGRKARLEGLMKQFEKRAGDAVERQTAAGNDKEKTAEKWDKKLTQTYDQLAQMMEQNPSTAVYNQATRAKLIENFMWIASDSTRGSQDVGNCWQMSGRNLTGMQNNPDAMARLLKEVSLTGTFTTVNGGLKSKDSLDRRQGDLNTPKKFTIPKNMLAIDRANAGWSLDKPDECYWQGGIGTMPSTPVGNIIDNVLGYLGGRKSHRALDGGLWESFNSPSGNTREGWYYGINELMYMATGERTTKPVNISSNNISDGDISRLIDKRLQKQLLENGGALLVGPGHMFAVKLLKNRGQWQIVADNQWGKGGDQVIGTVTDLRNWTVQRSRVRYQSDHDPTKASPPKPNQNQV